MEAWIVALAWRLEGQPDHMVRNGRLWSHLYREFVPFRPSHDRLWDLDPCYVRQHDGQGERFPWTHGQVTGHATTGTRNIPDGTQSPEGADVISDGALHSEAVVGPDDESHRTSDPRGCHHLQGHAQSVAIPSFVGPCQRGCYGIG
jgi:hypothetical protein